MADVRVPPLAREKSYPINAFDCEDIRVLTDDGQVIYSGPKYLRCKRPECNQLVTHGMAHSGGCWCGNRRLGVALRLTVQERDRLLAGYYPLCTWEQELIAPVLPEGVVTLGWGHTEWAQQYA